VRRPSSLVSRRLPPRFDRMGVAQRETDIFVTFMVEHYRPNERLNLVRMIDEKTGAESSIPSFDDAGAALYPELMAELDAIKRCRIGGPMLGPMRSLADVAQARPAGFHAYEPEGEGSDPAAERRDDLSFVIPPRRPYRTGDAELTDREIFAQSRGTPRSVAEIRQATTRQTATGTKKRALRERKANNCPNEHQYPCRMRNVDLLSN
jgi:hypothetical protein